MLHGLYLQTGTVYDFFPLWKENTTVMNAKLQPETKALNASRWKESDRNQ